MASQVANGKAFEWAVADASSAVFALPILANSSSENARIAFEQLNVKKQQSFQVSAKEAVIHIAKLEHGNRFIQIAEHIEIASDYRGKAGDVRDVLLVSPEGELGFSCKTNHDALKHSRLSSTIDFVKAWGLDVSGCSSNYWDEVRPLFTKLMTIQHQSNRTALFSDIADIHSEYYKPILRAFQDELVRVLGPDAEHPDVATAAFVQYVIGAQDFYKIINLKDKTTVQGFNFRNSLSIGVSKLPTHLVSVDSHDGGINSVSTRFNRGYSFNFRIHSASSRVEPSFKFDVRAISFETEIYQQHFLRQAD